MRTCFVPFCDVKNKDQPNRTMFLVPREHTLFAQWTEALPKVRTLRPIDKVCYLHFMPEDIVSTFDHCINGQVYKIKRDRPRLKPDALPCLEMTTNEELLSYRGKPRLTSKAKVVKMSDDNTLSNHIYDLIVRDHQERNEAENIHEEAPDLEEQFENSSIIIDFENDSQDFENREVTKNNESENQIGDLAAEESCQTDFTTNNSTNNEHLLTTKRLNLFNLLYDNAYEVLIPNSLWGIHRCPHRSFLCFSYMEVVKMQVTKLICIKTDGSVQLILNGNAIKSWQLLQDINDVDSLSLILDKAHTYRLCFGKSSNSNCDAIVDPNDDHCWFTEDNEQVFLCKFCLQMK